MILIQPDLGTAMVVLLGGVTMMFLAGIPLRLFVGAAAPWRSALPDRVQLRCHDYQRAARDIFFDPGDDPLGAGYHISQSKIAIGSGGLTGNGFLQGTQSHFAFLPEPHTDFIFATMAEEWGLLGGLFLMRHASALGRCAGGSASRSTREDQLLAARRRRA